MAFETLTSSETSLSSHGPQSPLGTPEVSFIVPVFNEEENVDAMVQEITQVGAAMDRSFEIVVVDDGSKDQTIPKLRAIAAHNPYLQVVRLKRNFGQTAATAAGFAHARGAFMVTLDGDLQNDPADAPRLLDILENEDLDIVTGWRKNRKDNAIIRKLPSMIANALIAATTGVKIHDNGCSLKVYRSEVAKSVPLYGEMHRFIPALASIDGAVTKEVPVNHRPRVAGKSKYNLSRTFKVILDLMTVLFMKRYMSRPLHMFGRLGLLFLGLGLLTNAYLAVDKLLLGHNIGDRPLLILGALLVFTGIQLICTGLIAEIQVRTYFESQQKNIYKVKEVFGGTAPAPTSL